MRSRRVGRFQQLPPRRGQSLRALPQSPLLGIQGVGMQLEVLRQDAEHFFPETMPLPSAIPPEGVHLHPGDPERPVREKLTGHPVLAFAPKHGSRLLRELALLLPVKEEGPHEDPQEILCPNEEAQEIIVLARPWNAHPE
jgi:hypothetical protein